MTKEAAKIQKPTVMASAFNFSAFVSSGDIGLG